MLVPLEWRTRGRGLLGDLLGLPHRRRETEALLQRVDEVVELCGLSDVRDVSAATLPIGRAAAAGVRQGHRGLAQAAAARRADLGAGAAGDRAAPRGPPRAGAAARADGDPRGARRRLRDGPGRPRRLPGPGGGAGRRHARRDPQEP
ncbi:hypothetical protein ACFSTC_21860 [Nonomuraea ferruginea]